MSTADLIFEIGTEELPSGDLNAALKALSFEKAGAINVLFESHNIKFNEAFTYSTPRRLVLYVKDIPLAQDVLIEGPPRRIAYDNRHMPTRALEAFLKKNNALLRDVRISNDPQDPRVLLNKTDIANADILTVVLPKVVSLIRFSKEMRWNETGTCFSRPIRWFLALFGGRIINFECAGISSSNITQGHRFLGRKNIKVKDADSYFRALRKNNVICENILRRERILTFLEKRRWRVNEGLLEEVNNLVEWPCFIEGHFSREYLGIPHEVLLAAMSRHQRIFCLQDKGGNLINRFIGVLNGDYRNRKQITRNFENVLDARLKDALFFYKSDTKKSLRDWAMGLDGIVFHGQLGTMAQKAARIKKISRFVSEGCFMGADKRGIDRAAGLCKADLLTGMVKEFPSLQGVMGMYYALDSGEKPEVARAVAEHYLPRFAGDDIPSSVIGLVCSLADKLDNIVCYFKIGKSPKGNWDPYALRRQAIGIISMLLEDKVHLSLSGVIDFAYPLCPGQMSKEGLRALVLDFFKDRFIVLVKKRDDYPHDIIDAVIGSGIDDLYKVYLKLNKLHSIINEIYFEKARVIIERTHNIIKASKDNPGRIDESLFAESREKEVYRRVKDMESRFMDYCGAEEYGPATRLFADTLSDCLHDFFDKVMVNVDHKGTRVNRLGLLLWINRLYTCNIADLSKVIGKNKGGGKVNGGSGKEK
jgi:glycyl-tRNA synthetase beta chain